MSRDRISDVIFLDKFYYRVFIDTYYGTLTQFSQVTGTMREAEGVVYRMSDQMMEGSMSTRA